MAKRLLCVHPHASYQFGHVEVVGDTQAAGMLGIYAGAYKCWELMTDLGPDAAAPAPQAPAAPEAPEEAAPKTDEEASPADSEATAKPKSSKK